MRYRSTRNAEHAVSFEEAVLTGLPPDGGLYIPETIPTVSAAQLDGWAELSYSAVAAEICKLYAPTSALPFLELCEKSYSTFDDPKVVAPLNIISDSLSILELWHGPTFAFKDVIPTVAINWNEGGAAITRQHVCIFGS